MKNLSRKKLKEEAQRVKSLQESVKNAGDIFHCRTSIQMRK